MTQLPAILKEEEDESYKNEAEGSDCEDILNKQHNSAVRTIAIGHIVEKVTIYYKPYGFLSNLVSKIYILKYTTLAFSNGV